MNRSSADPPGRLELESECSVAGVALPQHIEYDERNSDGSVVRRSRCPSEICATEDDALLWLMAYTSQLLQWKCNVEWLFAFISGKGRRGWPGPGDLWGVDEQGDLVLVEGKLAGGESPMEDFLELQTGEGPYELDPRRRSTKAGDTLDALVLEHHWEQALRKEMEYLARHEMELVRDGHPESHGWPGHGGRSFPGLVPYSRKRHTVVFWRDLYLHHIATRLRSTEYQHRVRSYLATRRTLGPAKPHYIAVVALRPSDPPRLPDRHLQDLRRLAGHTDTERVHVRFLRAQSSESRLTICSLRARLSLS